MREGRKDTEMDGKEEGGKEKRERAEREGERGRVRETDRGGREIE